MKKSLIATLVAAPLLSLSSMAFASEPVLLSAAEMDGVTAGAISFKFAQINQLNVSPVGVLQFNIANVGGGNEALVVSGNHAEIRQ